MCIDCWIEEGKPFDASENARKWAPVFADTDGFGPLHIVIEDWNLDDDNLEFCRRQSPSASETALLDAMQAMTWEERWATAILAEDPLFNPATYVAS